MKRTGHWAAFLITLQAGCAGDDGLAPDDVFAACGSDEAATMPVSSVEAFRAIAEAEQKGLVMVDDVMAPKIGLSPEGNVISPNIPPTFIVQLPKAATGSAGALPAERKGASIWAKVWKVGKALAWERQAHAQSCPPVSGDHYLFRMVNVRTPERAAYSAVSAIPRFVPSLKHWRRIMDGRIGQTVRLTMIRATFDNGRIVAGPFVQSKPREALILPM